MCISENEIKTQYELISLNVDFAMFVTWMFAIIWMTPTTDQSHDRSAKMIKYRFQTFYALKVNFNAVLCRASNSVTLFSFGSSILLVDWSQNVTMYLWRSSEARAAENSDCIGCKHPIQYFPSLSLLSFQMLFSCLYGLKLSKKSIKHIVSEM